MRRVSSQNGEGDKVTMKHRTIRSTTLLAALFALSLIFSTAAYGISVVFISAPSTGIAPYTATFQVGTIGGTPPFYYNWDFGDGQTTNTPLTIVLHMYSIPGTYTPVVTVSDKFGISASATNQIQILTPYWITDGTPTEEGFVIEWILPPGKSSIVQQTTNLVETPFTDLAKIPYPSCSYTDTVFETHVTRFYQVVPLSE